MQELELRKAISPYVCSSPDDFEAERKFLSHAIFPQLNQFCLQRGAHFSPFDILWSEKDDYFQNGHLLHFLLDFAKKCSPFLICLLGERYGPYRPEDAYPLPSTVRSVPDNDDSLSPLDKNFLMAGITGQSWILEPSHQTASILELEIIQAAFLGDNEHCNFYFRQKEHLMEKLDHMDANQQELYKCDFLPENEHAGLKVNDLKQRIVKKGLQVKYFKTITELGELVLDDWKEIIDMLYPPLYNDGDYIETEEYREGICQQGYALNHLENYVGSERAEDIMSQLTTFALTENKPAAEVDMNKVSRFQLSALSNYILNRNQPGAEYKSVLVMSGDRGIGKTTIIAKWLENFRQDNPEVMIVRHFVGCGQHSTDIAVILRRCIMEIKMRVKDKKSSDLFVELDQIKSFQELSEAFLATVSTVPCLLVIDGLDELGGSLGQTPQEVKDFEWLPFPLPPQCRLIVTTSRSDLTFHSLSKRADVEVIQVRNILDSPHKQLILMEHMKHNYQRLTRHNLNQILEIKLTEKPLFLELLASELSCYRVFTNLTAFLDNHYELCSVREFWMKSLKRWVADYSWRLDFIIDGEALTEEELETTGWVPDVLRLMVLSRNGLTQTEILAVLHQLGYRGRKEVSMLDWLAFRECLGCCLHEDTNGLFNFSHQHLTEVAEYTLFRSVKQAAGELKPTEDTTQKRIFHQHLALYFIKQPFSHRQLDELPWQLMMAGSFGSLIKILTHDKYLPCLLDVYMKNPSDRLYLKYYWSVLIKHGYQPIYTYSQYLVSVGLTELEVDNQSVCDTTRSLLQIEEAAEIIEPNVQHLGEITELDKFISENIKTSLAVRELSVIDENDEATSHTEKTLSGRSGQLNIEYCANEEENKDTDSKQKLPLSQLVSLSWHISQLLLELGYPDTTLNILLVLSDFLYKNYPLELFERLIFTRSLECVGNLYLVQTNQRASYRFYKKALRSVLELSDGDDEGIYETEITILKGNMLNQLGKMKMKDRNFTEAEDLFHEALECFEDLKGDQSLTANIQYELGILRLEQGDYVNTETYLKQSLLIREKRHGKSNILVSDNIIALARLYSTPENIIGYDKIVAESLYRRALAIREKCLGNEGLLVAEILYELGKLVGENTGYLSKTEAVSLLSRALDIKTQMHGSDHIETKTVQSVLTSAEVSIKLGQYQFGSARPSDVRSRDYPYSKLSFRQKDLEKVEAKEKDRQNQSRLSMNRSQSCDNMHRDFSPFSALNYISASEKLLLENERPPLIRRESKRISRGQTFTTCSEHATPVTGIATLARREASANISLQEMKQKEERDAVSPIVINSASDQMIDSYAMDSLNSPATYPPHPVTHVSMKKIKSRPNSAPINLLQKYNSINIGHRSNKPLANRSSSKTNNRRATSALLPYRGPEKYRPTSGISSHSSQCRIPGPHSIHPSTTQSVMGPHSSISSLLGPPPAPREVSKKIHHKSAWYHVPGRYVTSREKVPSKRSQTRPGATFGIGPKGHTGSMLTIQDLKAHQRSNSLYEVMYDVNEYGEIVPFTNGTTFQDQIYISQMNACS